jgi:hypothetical protein
MSRTLDTLNQVKICSLQILLRPRLCIICRPTQMELLDPSWDGESMYAVRSMRGRNPRGEMQIGDGDG